MLALWLALVEADSLALVEAESEDSSLLLGNVLGLPFIEVAALVEADSLADVLALWLALVEADSLALVEAESEDSSL
ncbi:hypothetical protein AYP75_04585 [Ligilactobacillus agilis]|uniref:Uncharacterized protein n=1 Tax=Ligilactobacillus agilis TaxID=1601 RepID=A0A226RQ00_9LACO|nr:hypothetical protein AYP74_06985 [Ligilactobacillus agilis]OXC11292.1 hypothetical protein AYP75_04585 [Ligilactobacillus agilis]OXS40310.1 hypothetical protein AYP69_05265 [Ligilactobacillus agilis]OXS48645.1 hypothetical protein AYP72_10055 [Ligilactobacillus agilis]OXS50834.1 hypothetical protein AYP73_04855 [Ligilactobacillus agilis]